MKNKYNKHKEFRSKFNLKEFDKVLVRDSDNNYWYPSFFAFEDKTSEFPYLTTNGNRFEQCIPYKGNEVLCNTDKEYHLLTFVIKKNKSNEFFSDNNEEFDIHACGNSIKDCIKDIKIQLKEFTKGIDCHYDFKFIYNNKSLN